MNVVVIVVDTLGARYAGVRSQNTLTPSLNRFAAKSVDFSHAASVSSWTKPAIASLLTGRYPIRHQVRKLGSVLSEKEDTLAELLGTRGFSTYGIVSHTLLAPKYGFHQGFDHYEIIDPPGNTHRAITSSLVTDRALELLKSHARDKRFFLFAHYFDPHYEYRDHEAFTDAAWYQGKIKSVASFRALQRLVPTFTSEDFKYLQDLYSEEIRFTDMHLGRLLEALETPAYRDNTLIFFTADHGEEFGEHGGLGHTQTLFQELVHVPLLMRLPGNSPGKKIPSAASQIDIVPTLLSLDLEQTTGDHLDGRSLLDIIEDPSLSERIVFSEVHFGDGEGKLSKSAALLKQSKLIRENFSAQEVYFDLSTDAAEKKPLGKDASSEFSRLSEALNEYWKQHQERSGKNSKEVAPSSDEAEKLKSLGYL